MFEINVTFKKITEESNIIISTNGCWKEIEEETG